MFWLLLGALLVLLAHNRFDVQHTVRDVRKIIRAIVKAVRNAVQGNREAGKAAVVRKEESEPVRTGEDVPAVHAESAETRESRQLVQEMEEKSDIASMLAQVPVLHFPEEDPKYDSSRKYNYA